MAFGMSFGSILIFGRPFDRHMNSFLIIISVLLLKEHQAVGVDLAAGEGVDEEVDEGLIEEVIEEVEVCSLHISLQIITKVRRRRCSRRRCSTRRSWGIWWRARWRTRW